MVRDRPDRGGRQVAETRHRSDAGSESPYRGAAPRHPRGRDEFVVVQRGSAPCASATRVRTTGHPLRANIAGMKRSTGSPNIRPERTSSAVTAFVLVFLT